MKEDLFAICGALALGESLLRRLGHEDEARHLATVFDGVEGRLARAQSVGASPLGASSLFSS
jgi:hypothetical protein